MPTANRRLRWQVNRDTASRVPRHFAFRRPLQRADLHLHVREASCAYQLRNPGSTPQSAYFCIWESHGDELTNALAGRPARVRAENRNYHLLTGPVPAVADVSEGFMHRTASLWWPRDRAWVVATEIDGYNTFVGASPDAVAALLVDPALEAVPAEPGTLLDPSPWPPD
jgi:hypothetical protein